MSDTNTHNASFDYVRLLAVFGVIWFHAHAPGALIGYSGLAFFLLLLVHLAVQQTTMFRDQPHRAPAFWRYAAARGQRLLLPWLIASGFYGALKLADVSQGARLGDEFQLYMWLTGPALHLWFLPFAFATCLALWPLGRFLMRSPANGTPPISFICTGLALTALSLTQEGHKMIPLAQWAYAMPVVLFGVALTCAPKAFLSQIGLLSIFLGAALSAKWTVGLLEIVIASLAFIGCSRVYLPPSRISKIAARSALTLYLIHPAVLAVVLRSGLAPDNSIALAVIVSLLSCAFVVWWDVFAVSLRTALTSPVRRMWKRTAGI